MSSMTRQHSDTSSTSPDPDPNPKPRLGFFKRLSVAAPSSFSSRRREGEARFLEGFDDAYSVLGINYQLSSDKTASSPRSPDLEPSISNGLPSPDSLAGATLDKEYQYLRDITKRLRKATSGPDPVKVDAVWEIYKKVRDEAFRLCKSLIQKSQNHERNETLAILLSNDIGPHDTRSSTSGSLQETPLPFKVNDQWLAAIREYKTLQEEMLVNLRNSLLATYHVYAPDGTKEQMDAFLSDKNLQRNSIKEWREINIHRTRSEKPLFWEQYKIRSLNFTTLKVDLQAISTLFDEAEIGKSSNTPIKEHIIAQNGDTILEFANAASEIHPILRFRVSSHLLAEASPLFSQFLTPKKLGYNPPLDLVKQLPPAPSRYTCKDGTGVQVYKMPQVELNDNNSLTILLHAAHMHHGRVPREIDFPVFVSIAEVCLRYQCTSPLELQVEYQWLPQWLHLVGDDDIDGFLFISYVFGIRRIFTRLTKTAILNALDDEDIESKDNWPKAVKDKIKATRTIKIAQINEVCKTAIGEYFKTPSNIANRKASAGSLVLTTLPRCPRGSHLCDAANLGWLMLVYNEIRILSIIMKDVGFQNIPPPSKRSLKDLVDCLRDMPSSPQVHSGVCDYSAAFRSEIHDIYNSVVGFTLREVTGRDGWALSKHAGPTDSRYDDQARDIIEPEAPLEYDCESKGAVAMSNEDIGLRILEQMHNMYDLMSAAMIDKSFYHTFKRNEARLLRNVMRAERKKTLSGSGGVGSLKGASEEDVPASNKLALPTLATAGEGNPRPSETLHSPPTEPIEPPHEDEFHDETTPYSPVPFGEVGMTEEEAHRIFWPQDGNDDDDSAGERQLTPRPVDRNDKCLLEDVLVQDKVRVLDNEKGLREDKDRTFGLGVHMV